MTSPLDQHLNRILGMGMDDGTTRGTPTQLMQYHLRALFMRMRQTIPFVATGPELLEACFPADLYLDSTKWANARLAMKTDFTSFFMLSRLDPRGAVSATEGVFWYRFTEDHAPRPFEEMAAFIVPEDAPCRKKLQKWFDQADELNNALMVATKIATNFAGAMKHPNNVQKYWPELYPFIANVGSGNRTFNKDIPSMPAHIAAVAKVDPNMSRKITDMLATATLLPDLQPDAWVGFHK